MLFVQRVVGKTYALTQAVFHIGLLLSGGVLFVAIAFLTSSLLDGEYTAPSACFVIIIALASESLAGTTRHFNSFSQAAEEAGVSRIYAGQHFRFDHLAGEHLGQQVARAVLSSVS
jgi:hypothetical protein